MKVEFSNYHQPNNYKTGFKATYPVRYWVRKADSKQVVQELDIKVIQSFQEKIIEYLNKLPPTLQNIKAAEKKKIKKTKIRPFDEMLQNLLDLLIEKDIDYRQNMTIRSYTNYVVPGRNLSFFITGHNVSDFNNRYAKPLGRAKKEAKGTETPELLNVRNNFNYGGYNYVNAYGRRLKNEGRTQVLNILFEIEQDEKNQIIGYKMADVNFTNEYSK